MDLTIINEIADKYSEEVIQKDCKLIRKKMNLKSAKDVGYVTELIVVLYICNIFEDAIRVCELLNDFKFNGDYTLWDNVVNARLIKSRILQNLGKKEEAYQVVEEIMAHENNNLWNNQSQCLILYDRNIQDAKQRNSKKDILSWQLIKYEMMIRFAELPSFPLDKELLNDEIDKLTVELREKISLKN